MYKKVSNNVLTRESSKSEENTQSSNTLGAVDGYELMWRKKTTKIHKTWEGDASGRVRGSGPQLYLDITAEGRKLASIRLDSPVVNRGTVLSANGYEFEIGAAFHSTSHSTSQHHQFSTIPKLTSGLSTTFKLNRPIGQFKSPTPINNLTSGSTGASTPGQQQLSSTKQKRIADSAFDNAATKKTRGGISTSEGVDKSFIKPFSTPFKVPNNNNGQSSVAPSTKMPMIKTIQTQPSDSKHQINVESCIDEQLHSVLRPHQIAGVDFIVNSVLGKRHNYGDGCILADEMGLGKTLTSIAAIHTLIRNKFVQNALIICPVTLISNWKAEFSKWLPPFRYPQFGVLSIDQSGMGNNSLKDPVVKFFSDRQFKSYQVMIVGYERVRLILPQITALAKEFDLVVCDEGHRLKTTNSKTTEAIEQLCGSKRVILTGTPIQNDLGEFWALANFTNPGIFGSEAQFNRRYAGPMSSVKEVDRKRDEAVEELTELCDEFMLRRDVSTIEKYVNIPKAEFIVFCRPSNRQSIKYQQTTGQVFDALTGDSSGPIDQGACLQAIGELKKIAAGDQVDQGGKLAFLSSLLDSLSKISPQEKIVIVSGSTRVLDITQNICISKRMSWLRLDGSTPQEKRQSNVNIFNKQSVSSSRVFLLSSRSGGMGLNLVGASRLVLLDCDWNPAIDAQVMGRIYRDGQKRPCFIYRLLTTGTIDEKMFQRQLSKINLSEHILVSASNGNKNSPDFSRETLKDIFSFSIPAKCNTIENARESLDIKGYTETSPEHDNVLKAACVESKNVSCIFLKKSQ